MNNVIEAVIDPEKNLNFDFSDLNSSMDQYDQYYQSLGGSESEVVSKIIPGVILKELSVYRDWRGWVAEIWRACDQDCQSVMSYMSQTFLEVVRGPHEHKLQTDYFIFPGIGSFELSLWDNRSGDTKDNYLRLLMQHGSPRGVIVPPGVVHAYKCVPVQALDCHGKPLHLDFGFCLNFPDKYYAGENRDEEVDEIRYENDINSPFQVK